MAAWVSKIRVVCPSGARVAKLIGSSYDDALKKGLKLDPGPGCKKIGFEVVQRGIGAGQRDRREGERLEGARRRRKRGLAGLPTWWPFGKKPAAPAKRHPMTRTVYYARTKNGSYIPVDRPPNAAMAGAKRRRKRRR